MPFIVALSITISLIMDITGNGPDTQLFLDRSLQGWQRDSYGRLKENGERFITHVECWCVLITMMAMGILCCCCCYRNCVHFRLHCFRLLNRRPCPHPRQPLRVALPLLQCPWEQLGGSHSILCKPSSAPTRNPCPWHHHGRCR